MGITKKKAARRILKTYSVQLPLQLADKLEALFKVHKKNARAKVLRDVLTLGLQEIEKASAAAGVPGFQPDTHQPVYLLTGPFAEFHGIIHQDRSAQDRQVFEEGTRPITNPDDYCLGYLE